MIGVRIHPGVPPVPLLRRKFAQPVCRQSSARAPAARLRGGTGPSRPRCEAPAPGLHTTRGHLRAVSKGAHDSASPHQRLPLASPGSSQVPSHSRTSTHFACLFSPRHSITPLPLYQNHTLASESPRLPPASAAPSMDDPCPGVLLLGLPSPPRLELGRQQSQHRVLEAVGLAEGRRRPSRRPARADDGRGAQPVANKKSAMSAVRRHGKVCRARGRVSSSIITNRQRQRWGEGEGSQYTKFTLAFRTRTSRGSLGLPFVPKPDVLVERGGAVEHAIHLYSVTADTSHDSQCEQNWRRSRE